MESSDTPKTGFRTQYGHYEFLVMLFGVAKAPTVFMYYMNWVFQPYLGQSVVIFIDDIQIYSHTLEEQMKHVIIVLSVLQEKYFFREV